MICSKCGEQQEKEQFYADNISGWSKICKSCRRLAHKRTYSKQYYKRRKIIKELEQEETLKKLTAIENRIDQLRREHKRFTISNRARIKQLHVNISKESPDPRSLRALELRLDKQREADAILSGQIQLVNAGVEPHTISDIWRMNHGKHTRSQSKEESQTTTGRISDIPLLTLHGGDGEVGSS